jgi:hypothetical protein
VTWLIGNVPDILTLSDEQAERLARGIVGADAEDVVQDVTLYLLEKRGYQRAVPGPAYFLTAVRKAALRRLVYAWSRYVVAMDTRDTRCRRADDGTRASSQNMVPVAGAGGVSCYMAATCCSGQAEMRRPRKVLISGASFMVAGAGFEPATFGL